MRRLTGQAARHVGRGLHFVCATALLVATVGAASAAVLAWRLSQGPLDVRWLARRLEAAAGSGGGTARLAIGSAAIAWEGFRRGVDVPLDIRLTDITATDAAGLRAAEVPRAEITLSPAALLTGQLRPRRVEVDGARLRLLRAADGTVRLDLGDFAEADDDAAEAPADTSPSDLPSLLSLLTEFGRPAGRDGGEQRRSPVAHLTHLQIRDASLVVVDRQLGATWRVPTLDMRFDRLAHGGLEGHGGARLALGDERTTLTVDAVLAPGGASTQVVAQAGPVDPAALARSARVLAPLAALAAPVSATLRLDLGPGLRPRSALLDAAVGQGVATVGTSVLRLTGATLRLEAMPERLVLRNATVGVQPREGGPVSHVQVAGDGSRSADRFRAALTLDLDQAAFADLGMLWPQGAGPGARSWVTQNITAGTARDAHVEARLEGPADFSSAELTAATGTIAADGLTVYWLRPLPPVERGRAKLHILDPDTIEITADAGTQRVEAGGVEAGGVEAGRVGGRGVGGRGGDPLVLHAGKIRITGIEHPDQFGAIEADISGGIADAVALLKHPRLRLLDRHPLPGRDPSGEASVKLSVQLPLEDKVRIEDIAIRARAKLADAHLADLVGGHDLDDGMLDLTATGDGLTLSGSARLAGIPSDLGVDMDFRAGPPAQLVQKVRVAGRASTRQMAAIGLDAGPAVSGAAEVEATLTERRDGKGSLQASADLAGAELSAPPVDWRKPMGAPARLLGQASLEHDRFVSLDSLSLDGKDVSIRARGDFADGHLTELRFDRFVLGRSEGEGTLRFPPPGQRRPIEAAFRARVIDLSAATTRRTPDRDTGSASGAGAGAGAGAGSGSGAAPGPPWTLDARFDRAMMANGTSWLDIGARADNDGTRFTRLSVNGQTAPGQAFRLDIAPGRSGRSVTADAADAGALLDGLDVITTMRGGRLTVRGDYDDRRADHPLAGTAEITDFRVRDPHGLGKLLQAMTLYGLVQAASGPGLGFSRATAPFTLTDDALVLGEARAFNPSLGLTAKGRIDLRRSTADIEGTIVPAYFFNSLLGHIPLLGRLFSPEDGGGLFAASYAVTGPLEDPSVSVNPLSALTPGFLRGVFGLF